MTLMGEKDRRFRSLERKVGAFVVLALTAIVLIVLFIGVQRDLFTPKTRIYFLAESAAGFTEGQPVKFKGFRIGKVEEVMLNDLAQVEVTLLINNKHMKWVRQGAIALLVQEGVIGESVIEITSGSGQEIAEDAVIPFKRSTGIGDLAEEVKDQVEVLIGELRKIVEYINNPEGDIKATLNNLETFTAGLNETRENIDRLISDREKGLIQASGNIKELAGELREKTVPQIDVTLKTIKQAFEDVDDVIVDVDNRLPGIMDDLKGTLEGLRSAAADIANAASDVPPVVQEGGLLVDDTREVVGAVKEIWPVKNHIEPPEEKTLEVDSYE